MNNEILGRWLKANCYGRAREKGGRELCQATGLCDSELRRRIARLRRDGVPIASSRTGYFYGATAGEVYQTIRFLKEMATGLERSIRGLEKALERFGEEDDGHF